MAVPRIPVQGPDLEMVRLAPGAHSSPQEGVCVVELASLLAGEKFSDRPACVCDVIAGYLRSWNDRTGHAERQRLAPYSFRAIGTGGDPEVTRRRRDLCLGWAGAKLGGGRLRSLLARLAMRLRIFTVLGFRHAIHLNEGAGEYAARVAFARSGVREGFAMLDRLIELGSEPRRGPAAGNGNARLEAASLAHAVAGESQARVAATIRELAGDTDAAHGENNGKGGHNGAHLGDLGRRHARKRDKEHV
jgi:hypothetical protein